MGLDIVPGLPVSLLVPSISVDGFMPGTVALEGDGSLTVEMEQPVTGAAGARVLVFVGTSIPVRAEAELASRTDGPIVELTLTSPWQAIDQREHPRYRTQLPATLLQARDGATTGATVLDLSEGGAAVEVEAWDAERFSMELEAVPERFEIVCDIIDRETSGEGELLHCRFVALDDAEAQRLRALIAEHEQA